MQANGDDAGSAREPSVAEHLHAPVLNRLVAADSGSDSPLESPAPGNSDGDSSAADSTAADRSAADSSAGQPIITRPDPQKQLARIRSNQPEQIGCRSQSLNQAGFLARMIRFVGWSIHGSFCIASLIVLLAVLTALPLLQLIAFGYLLAVAGGLARGSTLRESLPHLHPAGRIGMAAAAVFFAALPTQLLVHWESVAYLIDPGSGRATAMRALAITSAVLATFYLLWAWVRGGRLRHYLWPQPKRLLREGWRWSTWHDAPDRLWNFTASLELPRFFWIGLRGAVGTLVWLIPAMIIRAAFREGETGLAGLIGAIALVFLGIALLYLPMLQAHFAADNRIRALFEVRTIRRDFRRAPWAWFVAMLLTLVITPIPLYLLKIEATPREVTWLPCLVFVAFILPARIATGLALRRARRRPEPSGIWARISRWTIRLLLMPLVVAIYLLFVYVSQYTSWDGLETWVQQHAILIPVPFLSGV